jgi:1-acyl-sn-glycerol-3-phosphate acyltransferase
LRTSCCHGSPTWILGRSRDDDAAGPGHPPDPADDPLLGLAPDRRDPRASLAAGTDRRTGSIPYKPGKNDLLDATRRVGAVIRSGGVVAIAGEGRIGAIESSLLPISEGAAYFALRSNVPIVPIAVNGTSWLHLGGRARVRIGMPIDAMGRPNREAVATLTGQLREALEALIADAPAIDPPGRVGQWLTERFNEWPEGSREAARDLASGG